MKSQRPITLLTGLCFLIVAVSGVIAFATPFSLRVVGLHALTGFAFVALAVWHVRNSFAPFKRHLRSRILWVCLAATALLAGLFWWQPAPIRSILGLSKNLGSSLTEIAHNETGITLRYTPSADYRMQIDIQMGPTFDPASPPAFAVWLENASSYHIKTLHSPEAGDFPYWASKVKGWEEAKDEFEEIENLDAVSGATANSSFDPLDYIRPADPENPMPYTVLVEVNQPNDPHNNSPDQPSLVYSVEIDNLSPNVYQLLELFGYPKSQTNDEGDEEWNLYYPDGEVSSALGLIDSALVTIER